MRQGVVIPADDPRLWHDTEPEHVSLEDVPVLYAGEAPTILFHEQGSTIRLGFDPIRAAFWLLSRQEELGMGDRDSLGRFDCSTSWLIRHGLAEIPIVDLYADLLAKVLVAAAQAQGIPLLRKGRWPKGQAYAVALSHDVDDAGRFTPGQGLRLLTKAVSQRSPRVAARGVYFIAAGLLRSFSQTSDPYWNFEAVMDLETGAGFRSTFFLVPDASNVNHDPPYEIDTPQLRDLLARLHAGGWEVAVHGSFDSYLDAGILRTQRQKMERLSGVPVCGVRQHYVRLRLPDTFRAQVEADFAYDSTLGFRSAVGFRAGAAFPFHPFDTATGQSLPLVELPLTIMDGPLFWQLGLTPFEATARSLALLEKTRAVRGLAVLDWHQRVWYEKRYPGWSQVYREIVEHLRDEGLAWVATAGQIAAWWFAREDVQLVELYADGRLWHWRYRAGQAMDGLMLSVAGACSNDLGPSVTVLGADSTIRLGEGGEAQVVLTSLAPDQTFEIRVEHPQ
jgi:hypothetical protein